MQNKAIGEQKYGVINTILIFLVLLCMIGLLFYTIKNVNEIKNNPCKICEEKYDVECVNIGLQQDYVQKTWENKT